jgi:hypothetical protein
MSIRNGDKARTARQKRKVRMLREKLRTLRAAKSGKKPAAQPKQSAG